MSVSFDRVAGIYDATRGFPPGVDERIADAIARVASAGPDTRFLEVGVGTGRIALPLIRRGYPYTGVDVSPRMLDQLRLKVGDEPHRLTLVEADATSLPFPDCSFDVALTAHVLHLVSDWRGVLAEIRRVLAPGGVYLHCYDRAEKDTSRGELDAQFDTILARHGVQREPVGAREPRVVEELREQEAHVEIVTAAEWRVEYPLRDLLERYEGRVYSSLWGIPDDVFEKAIQELKCWAAERYPVENAVFSSFMRFEIAAARHWASV